MELVSLYQCFSDHTRLRILAALIEGPLCVCHLQEILGESQVKVSKRLAYLKEHGMVEAERQANWMIYQLPAKQPAVLRANLACLQNCVREDVSLQRDARRAARLRAAQKGAAPFCS